MPTLRWKFINKNWKSANGDTKWKMGVWSKPIKDLDMCESGYHCSRGVYQAFSYVQGEILARVECKGKHDIGDDKEVWETMRVVEAYKWTKEDSVALSIYAAELCIKNYEKVYSNDNRPRDAIEAAKKWLKNPTTKNRSAAWSATSAAWSAASAAASAGASAASAAASAAWSATSAAWSATSAAWSAGASAASAAASAERSNLVKKIATWMSKRQKTLEEIQ